ncbi:MAG: type III PLP-dependent enzyme [Gammaproteobacteria bacterium]|nr:type III PLP-dependent enzyme [Gammaproteobacteria bacterium]
MDRINIESTDKASFYQQMVEQHGSPLLILDCDQLVHQAHALMLALPEVKLFYAIKSLPHSAVLKTLEGLGVGFDIASSGEIDLLKKQGALPRNTIHTHPIKRDKDIRNALRFGCTTFVIDNIWELEKFIAYRHRVGLLIRISFPNPNTAIDLSRKFGCRTDEVSLLIQKAKSLGIHVKGLSFHAGSQCPDSANHVFAIQQCAKIIDEVYENSGKLLSILDIGGGFPVEYIQQKIDIDTFCKPIRAALSQLPEHVQVIAEPGRFLSAPTMTAVSTIMGKARRGETSWYYLDDGVYGSYSGQLFDHAIYPVTIFSDIAETETAVLAGPTCDSIDVIAEQIQLPILSIGDIVVGHQMGAYTSASSTDFNLFDKATVVVINQLDQNEGNVHRIHEQQ